MQSPTSVESPPADLIEAAETALDLALKNGADAADVVAAASTAVSAQIRKGALEEVEREETRDLGLRVFVGHSTAIVSTNDLAGSAIGDLAARAVAMAKVAPEDPHADLAPESSLCGSPPDLDLADRERPDTEQLAELARRAEAASLAVKGVTNSLGSSASASDSHLVLATSQGFLGAYESTRYGISCSAVAGAGTAMQRDYDYSSARHFAELDAPEAIGRKAAERAVARVNPQKAETGPITAVYEPRVAGSLLGHLASAINGRSVARRSSFLQDRMGDQLFRPGVTVVDDPLVRRGRRSRPFDGEGLPGRRRELVADGRLAGWLLDLAAAHQLGLEPTGNASRGIGSPPSPATSNLWLEPGTETPKGLIAQIDRGIFLTGLIGMGVNGVTGDYSRGAEGFLIEQGEVTVPVSEVTIAGNLIDMFARLVPADDLEIRYGTDAPTIIIEGMTLAGR